MRVFRIGGLIACFVAGLVLVAGSGSASWAQTVRPLGKSGDWFGEGLGGMDYYSTNAGGSSLVINCDVAQSLDHEFTGISLVIGSGQLPAKSPVVFDIDGETISFTTNDLGDVALKDCTECGDKFRQLWPLVRSGSRLEVSGANGKSAVFSLKGTAKLLPEEVCPIPGVDAAPGIEGASSEEPVKQAQVVPAPARPARPAPVQLVVPQDCGLVEPSSVALSMLGEQAGSGRVAFVVGMANYRNGVPPLRNPVNDIKGVVGAFRDLGFAVYYSADSSADAVRACAERLRAEHPEPQVAAFYYAGHGIQISDENYLVMADANLAADGNEGFVRIGDILGKLHSEEGVTLVFLDACRDNPFGGDGPSGLSASTGRGLKVAKRETGAATGDAVQPRGISVSYSTSPNAVAQDGTGEMSPFATAFVEEIVKPGHPLQRVMSAVANSVGEATDWTQTPWTRSSLTAQLKLAGPMTIEEAQAASENWARRSRTTLEKGRRLDAIAAALKGIPAHASEASAKRDYPLAFEALTNAYLSGNAIAPPEIAKVDGRLIHGFWMSPDRSRYAHAYGDQDYKLYFNLYRTSDNKKIAALFDGLETADFLTQVAFSRDGKYLAGGIDNLSIWDAKSGRRLKRFSNTPIAYFDFSPNAKSLLSVAHYGSDIHVMSTDDGRVLAQLDLDKLKRMSSELSRFLAQHKSSTVKAGYAGDNRICIAVTGESSRQASLPVAVGFYDLASGRYEMDGVLDAKGAWFQNGVQCSDDGRWIAVSAADEAAPAHLYFYDTKTRKTVGEIDAMSDKGRAVFGPGSDLVAVDVFNGAAIYDVARRKYVAEEMGDRSASHPTLFAPSGDRKGDDDKHMPYYVWSLLPSGTDLLQAAAGQLSKAQAGRVVAERIGLWQIN